MKTVLACSLLLACVATRVTADEGYRIQFTAKSVKSDLFAPLRANKTMVLTSECGKIVTDLLGILEQTYKIDSAKHDSNCTWYLHAPSNHVINIISVLFIMEDETAPSGSDDIKTSTISLYDGAEVKESELLTRYFVTPQEKVGYFIKSLSSKQNMTVEIKYHQNKDFATQKMLINYEFIDVDKMNELLRASN